MSAKKTLKLTKSWKRPNRSAARKPSREFDIVFVEAFDGGRIGPAHKRPLALRIEGEDRDVVSLRLDSDQSRTRQARRWSDSFCLDFDAVEDRLRRAAVSVTAELQDRQYAAMDAKLHGDGVRGAKSPPVTPITVDEARPTFARWIVGLEPGLLDVVLGTVMAHRLDGDPCWLFLVGPPGDGKTEILRSMSDSEAVFVLSSIKPAALISGLQIENGTDPSLLPKLDGKVLVVKDFTTVLTMPNEARGEILGTLRDAYDGEAGKAFGTGEVKRYRSRFGLLAAVTPAIESYWGVSAQLGERFVRFHLHGKLRVAKVRRALGNANGETTMRQELSAAALGVLAQTPATPTVPPGIEERLIHLADFVSRSRSEVARNRQGVVQYIPAAEVGTRVGKALKKLAMGIAMARGSAQVNEEVYRITCRVAFDSVPSMRGRLLQVLWEIRAGHELTATIADRAELATETAKSWLDDLRLLGIADRACAGANVQAGYSWRLSDEFQRTVSLSGVLADGFDGSDQGAHDSDDGPPPDSAPLTPVGFGMTPGESGVQNHLPPHPAMGSATPDSEAGRPEDQAVVDDSDAREAAAIRSVEAEAELVGGPQLAGGEPRR